jgi:phenylacetate-CoA ligase
MDWSTAFFKYFIYAPVVLMRREPVFFHLPKFNRSQWFDEGELQSLQQKKLRNLLKYAKEKVPYYKRTLKENLHGNISLEGLREYDCLDKNVVQAAGSNLHSKDIYLGKTKKTTGGSTGQAVTIWKTPHAISLEYAAAWRGSAWAGVSIGDKQARFWGVPLQTHLKLRARLVDLVNHRVRCSAFSFNEESMASYTKRLNRFKPKYLYGYVSMLTAYAEFLKTAKLGLEFPLNSVITTSEILSNYSRTLLEETFSCKVYNEYGCGEIGTIAHQCEQGSLHINCENFILEILNGDQPAKPGELGDVVVTELNNYAMPLIRYRLGDIAALSDRKCLCGRGLPVLDYIAGRAYDFVINREGKKFHGEAFMYLFEEVFRNNLGVLSFQVIQLDLDHFHIKIQPGKNHSLATEELILRRVQEIFGQDSRVEFELVEEIKREASGKMRLIVGIKRKE